MNPEGKQLHIHTTPSEKIIQIPFPVNGSGYRLADDCLFYLTVLSCTHLTLLTANIQFKIIQPNCSLRPDNTQGKGVRFSRV